VKVAPASIAGYSGRLQESLGQLLKKEPLWFRWRLQPVHGNSIHTTTVGYRCVMPVQ
jgi:hypothetical protein